MPSKRQCLSIFIISLFCVSCASTSITPPAVQVQAPESQVQSASQAKEQSSRLSAERIILDYASSFDTESESELGAESFLEDELPVVDDPAPLTYQERMALKSMTELAIELDEDDEKLVEKHFKFFTHRYRSTFEKWLKRSELYIPLARDVFRQYDLPDELIYLGFVESGFNPRAYSRAGAAGLWQFMPGTGKKYNLKYDWWVDDRRDPVLATHAAARHLKDLYERFGDWYLALAAYNAGEGKIARAVKDTGCTNFFEIQKQSHSRLRSETKNYVPKFLAILKILRNLESLGFEPINWDNAPELAEIKLKPGTDLMAMAKHCGLTWNEFHLHNPCYRRYVSPPDNDRIAYLPFAYVDKAREFTNRPGSTPYAGYLAYKVRSGDSWYSISKRHNVPVAVLKKVNQKSSNIIHPGQTVMVPGQGSDKTLPPREKSRVIAQKRGNYIIQRGDTLYDISKASGVSIRALMEANGLKSARLLQVGQKLYIPGQDSQQSASSRQSAERAKNAVTYRVRPGDTLWDIAQRFGVNHNDLMKWNQLTKQSLLHPGDALKVFVD